jgi:hypothetical protein
MPPRETKKALIVVRTYPTPARNGAEVSCTAAITDKGEWLRLFPVPWRYLAREHQFRRYQWVEVTVEKASDPRPESYKLTQNGIKILTEPLTAANEWRALREIVEPMRAHCLCCLVKARNANQRPTLGLFRPRKIERLIITPEADPAWTPAQAAILEQGHLFAEKPRRRLEKIPFKFQYHFLCDEDTCTGHTLTCTDWEMAEAWRKWRIAYRERWDEKFRLRFEKEMIERCDTHFFVGTIHAHPGTWIIVGLFYPPHLTQATLALSL